MQSGSAHVSIPHGFLPLNIFNFQIVPWLTRGITSLEDLYEGASIYTFSELQNKYGLPHAEYYKYLQITHLLKPIVSKQKAIPSQVLRLLTAPTSQPTKGSRHFYSLFTYNDIFSNTFVMGFRRFSMA